MQSSVAPSPVDLNTITDGKPERIVAVTRHNTDCYNLPSGVGEVLKVRLSTGAPKAFLFLEAPDTRSYHHLLANGVRPASPDEARAYLKLVYDKFRTNLWYRLGDSIFLFPVPPNSGDNILIDYQP